MTARLMDGLPQLGHYPGVAAGCGSDAVALHQAAGDHQPLDVTRALADQHERGVAVVALDPELPRVAVAAEDAHGVEADPLARLGREELGHTGLDVHALAAVLQLRGAAGEEPGGLDGRGHVRETELHRLVLADGLPE